MRRALTALAAAAAIAGCGIDDPYRGDDRQVESVGDARPPADDRPPGSLRTPDPPGEESDEAIRTAVRYALAQGNWSWRTFRAQYAQMRALAHGELASELEANPPDQDVLLGLERERQTNSARPVAATKTQNGAVIVVLRERAGARGVIDQAPAHRVYRATVVDADGAPKVAAWQLLP